MHPVTVSRNINSQQKNEYKAITAELTAMAETREKAVSIWY